MNAKQKPKCKLINQDGNIFNLLAIARMTLRRIGLADQGAEMSKKVFSCHSYDEALNIIGKYVDIC